MYLNIFWATYLSGICVISTHEPGLACSMLGKEQHFALNDDLMLVYHGRK